MEKKFVIPSISNPPSKKPVVINWNLCIFCQEESDEFLLCPARKEGEGYTLLAANLEAFHKAQFLPCDINIEALRGDLSLVENLAEKRAKFHKKCRANFTEYKLNRRLNSASRDKSEEPSNTGYFTRSLESTETKKTVCLFCESEDGKVHAVETKELSDKIKAYAEILQDQKILAKFSEGDAIAIEAKYHFECLTKFCNRKRSADRQSTHSDADDSFAIAFAELTSYVQDCILEKEGVVPVFNLKQLTTLLENRLEQLTGEKKTVHATRLKNMLLNVRPELTAYNQGRDVLITTNKNIGDALRKACKFDAEADLPNVGKLVRKIRQQAFETKPVKVCTLDKDSQATCVSPLLLVLVKMLLYGPNCKQQAENHARQEAMTIAQLIHFNMKLRTAADSGYSRHACSMETPFPTYLSLMLHCKTREKNLVDTVHKFGIGISYDRVLQISSALSQSAIDYFQKNDVVCSPYLQKGHFVTGAVDNIDLNTSSTTANSSFHGTAISLQQHYKENAQITNLKVTIPETANSKKVPKLPAKYTTIAPLFLKKEDAQLPKQASKISFQVGSNRDDECLQRTKNWLEHVEFEILTSTNSPKNISWGSFNSQVIIERNIVQHRTKSELLPMFREVAHTPAMIAHAMKIVAESTDYLNKGQVPVITCDAPLYALAKQIQWNNPEKFGEHKFVVMLGGLHIEKAMLSVLGDVLDDSGWVESLIEAEITSSGRAQSFIQVQHITRTRYAHQVTLCALFILQKRAYSNYVLDFKEENIESIDQLLPFEKWVKNNQDCSPQFLFWSIVMELEEYLLEFLTSIRSANFQMYLKLLTKFSPWFFTFNHFNYARWLPIYIHDMANLEEMHPSIFAEFSNGKFTANISGRKFSAMALDQAHEQCNCIVKGDGGAVGLTENPDALLRWMVGGPEVSRVIQEFERSYGQLSRSFNEGKDHHESARQNQYSFSNHIQNLVKTIENEGNPFEKDQHELQNLHNKRIISETGVAELEALRDYGRIEFENFVRTRLIEGKEAVFSPLKKNNFNLFKKKLSVKSKAQLSVKSARNDASLFSRLYIVCQQRGSDLDDFFSHENQPFPPALSDLGQIKKTKKSALLQCLKEEVDFLKEKPSATCVILDGAAAVHMIPPGDSKTFCDYIKKFSSIILNEWKDVGRFDIVWDEYRLNSLKAETRTNRGLGIRRKVCLTTPVPRNWHDFLRNSENKRELFALISRNIVHAEGIGELISTEGHSVRCSNSDCSHEDLQPCNHEEADTRLLLHAKEASQNGHKSIIIRTVDTDVVVISLAAFEKLNSNSLWIAFGTGKDYEFVPIHQLFKKIGADIAAALPFFHALTGCDTTSSFNGHGKLTAWETLNNFPEVLTSFQALSNMPTDVEAAMNDVECFVILMYDKTSSQTSINQCRKELFTKKGRFFDKLPPTQAALRQHVLRCAYQAGHCWGQCLDRHQQLPDPKFWGWTDGDKGEWEPTWTSLPEASLACRELISCGCKNCSTKRCKCKKALLKCTMLCKCEDCENGHDKYEENTTGMENDNDDLYDEESLDDLVNVRN